MARTTNKSTPLTFDVDGDTLAKIEALKQKKNRRTNSAVIVDALRNFDFSQANIPKDDHRQLSVRLDSDLKAQLKAAAEAKNLSLGALVRLAILKLADEELGAKAHPADSRGVNPSSANNPTPVLPPKLPNTEAASPLIKPQSHPKKPEQTADEWWKI